MRTLLLILCLSGCAAQVPPTAAPAAAPAPAAPVVATADRVILTSERAFTVAELAYTTAAIGVGKLADRGLLSPATASWLRARNVEARALLVRGKATLDAAERARAAAALLGLAAQFDAIREGK